MGVWHFVSFIFALGKQSPAVLHTCIVCQAAMDTISDHGGCCLWSSHVSIFVVSEQPRKQYYTAAVDTILCSDRGCRLLASRFFIYLSTHPVQNAILAFSGRDELTEFAADAPRLPCEASQRS